MTSTAPADRYPQRQSSSSRRRWFIISTAVVVVLGFVLAVVGYRNWASDDIKGEMKNYRIVSEQEISADFMVTRKHPEDPVVCIVRVRSKDGSETGRREVYVRGGTDENVMVTTSIYGSHPPAVADVYGCSGKVPGYLREDS